MRTHPDIAGALASIVALLVLRFVFGVKTL